MKYYNYYEIDDFLKLFSVEKIVIRRKKGIEYYNIPCCFDIETTSAYKDIDENIYTAKEIALLKEKQGRNFKEKNYLKCSWMYIWQLSIDGNIIIGRTWEQFKIVINSIIEKFELGENKRIIIFVQNLAFEFQFLKSIFKFDKIFATEQHKIIYGITNGLMFRCSYFLSGCSLEQMGKELIKYKCEKKTGDLDYDKIRHSNTKLNEKEINYCLYDVIVLDHYIREKMEDERFNSILNLPLTKTGYVRRYCKNYCLKGMHGFSYKKLIDSFIYDSELYDQLKKCYAGAHTHANALNVGKVFNKVHSYDFTSSYPYCLLAFKYPMGKAYKHKVSSLKEFYYNIKNYCCMFDITFKNIKMRDEVDENIISASKCTKLINHEENNGKVVNADWLEITINEVDFRSIWNFYTWDSISVKNLRRYKKSYLPKELIECIIHFYSGKTELKDVEGKENEYLLLKSMLNAIYGMCVTDIVRDSFILDDLNLWCSEESNTEDCLNHYNSSRNRFIAYEWGVWCTSYARLNLFTGIKELKSDFIYADTDSLKFVNLENHLEYFEKYNDNVISNLKEMCNFYDIDFNDLSPKTKDGVVKIIGLWDYEGCYDRFKTLGAKRYAFENLRKDNNIIKNGFNITVAGVNKKIGGLYIINKSIKENKDVFDIFDDDLYFDVENTGKLIHTYIDYEIELKNISDYQGNKCDIYEKSSVHLEPTSYSLSITEYFKIYINKYIAKQKRDI